MIEYDRELTPSDCLVVAFSGIGQGLGGMKPEFRASLRATDCAAFYVRDTARRWFQYEQDELDRLRAAVDRLKAKAGAKRLVCVGSSMGGFGALLFGSLWEADAVVAFSPQTAIRPDVLELLEDDRWAHLRAEIGGFPFGDLAALKPPPITPTVCVTGNLRDRRHVARLAAHWPLNVVQVPGADHDAARQMRDQGQLLPLLKDAMRPNNVASPHVSAPEE